MIGSRSLTTIGVAGLLILALACSNPDLASPGASVSPATAARPDTVTATLPPAQCDPAAFPDALRPTIQQQLSQEIGGGQVRQGPYTFCLILYSDPAIKSRADALMPALASDIPGVGWTAEWVYHGSSSGSAVEKYGPIPGIQAFGTYNLRNGLGGGRGGGGVVLPEGAKVGDRVAMGIQMEDATGRFGARISFTLSSEGGRLQPRDVSVLPGI